MKSRAVKIGLAILLVASLAFAQDVYKVPSAAGDGPKTTGGARFQIVQITTSANLPDVMKIDTTTGETWSLQLGNVTTTHSMYVWIKIPNVMLTANGIAPEAP